MTRIYTAPSFKRSLARGLDGILTAVQHEDETKDYVFDLGDSLASGETISSATVEENGVNATLATATDTVTATVSGTGGWIVLAVTLSTGSKQVYELRFLPHPDSEQTDYL